MFTNGLEGKEETEENLKYFKDALVFLGKEKMEYFESIGFILNNYENLINEISLLNLNFQENLKHLIKVFKFLMIIGFLNIPFYFTIENIYFKLIFIIMNSIMFTIPFVLFLMLSIRIKN